MRITRKMVESKFEQLAKVRQWETGYSNGAYILDYYNPGGNKYVWRIDRITSDSGARSHVFPSNSRLTTSEMFWALDAALHVVWSDL